VLLGVYFASADGWTSQHGGEREAVREEVARGMQTGREPPERQQEEPCALDEATQSRLVSLAVRRAQEGDRDAFAFLYARFSDDVCRYAQSIVRNHHDAEDVTQQVFTKLFAAIEKYEEREVPFLAWMLRVTRNVAVDRIRRQRTVPVAEVRASAEARDGAPSRARDLMAALSELPDAQREVVMLRHFAGLSPAEIAAQTGRSEGAVHGLHHRARKSLVRDLTREGLAPVTAFRGNQDPPPG